MNEKILTFILNTEDYMHVWIRNGIRIKKEA